MDPAPGFSYKYSLFVDGKPFEQFRHSQAKALRIWEVSIADKKYRVVLEKDTLNIFVNGVLREEEVRRKMNLKVRTNHLALYFFIFRFR